MLATSRTSRSRKAAERSASSIGGRTPLPLPSDRRGLGFSGVPLPLPPAGLELRTPIQVRSIEVILARDADQGEKGVTSRVDQGGAHAMRARRIRQAADRPIGRDPFARGVRTATPQ